MSIKWTIVDPPAAAQLADAGFATYLHFAERQPGRQVGISTTTQTTRLSIKSEPRTEVRSGMTSGAVQHGSAIGAHSPLLPPAAAEGSDVFFIKRYRYAGDQWRHRFRRDKASLEAANCVLLDQIGIGTAAVVAFGSRRRGLRLLDAVIVTRELPDVVSLDRLFESRWPHAASHGDDPLRRDILDAVLREVRRMHDAGFFHIDLQWRNILIDGLSEGRINVYFLDAPRGGLRRTPWSIAHGRLRDLSCLYKEARRRLSRTEQLRWLLIYLGEAFVTPAARSMIEALLFDRTVKDNE